MWFKKTLFDPAIQVPLIIAHPDHEQNRVSTPVSLLDLFPTILDIAGLAADDIQTPIEGKNLFPALKGEKIDGPVFVEHIDGGTAAPRVMVRDGDKKLTLSRGYPPQLFDLKSDPRELHNLAGGDDSDEARLTEMAEANWELDTLDGKVLADQTARKLVDSALSIGRQEIWDFTPRPLTQNTNYVRRGDAFPTIERCGYLPYKSKQ